jgi:hypothetical protein
MAQLCANEADHNKTVVCDADQFTPSELQTALLSHLWICYCLLLFQEHSDDKTRR